MDKLEELEQKYKELGEEIEKLKNKSNTNWRAYKGKRYYYITDYEDTTTDIEDFGEISDFRYRIGNYFGSERNALDALEKLEIYSQLKELANELNNGRIIDWNNGYQDKYYFYFSTLKQTFVQYSLLTTKVLGQTYCLDRDFLNKAIDKIGENRLKLLFDIEDEEVKK